MKICKGSLQALLSSAPRGFAARSRVLARPVSLAQTGELARRLQQEGTKKRSNGGKKNFIPMQNRHDLLVGTLSIRILSIYSMLQM